MTYEEKGGWVYLLVSAGVYTAYVVAILGQAASTALADVSYVPTMLWSIGAAIVLAIVGRILVEIAKPSGGYKADARDKDINRLGEYVGGLVLGIGMVLPLVLTIFEADHFWIANAIYLVFVLSAIIGTTVKLVAYRRGF